MLACGGSPFLSMSFSNAALRVIEARRPKVRGMLFQIIAPSADMLLMRVDGFASYRLV